MNPRKQIAKLLRLANDPEAAEPERAAARRHVSRLLGLVRLADDIGPGSGPRGAARAPGASWGRYRPSSPCSGCPLEGKGHRQCRTCEDRPR